MLKLIREDIMYLTPGVTHLDTSSGDIYFARTFYLTSLGLGRSPENFKV